MGLPDDTFLGYLLEWENKIFFTNVTRMSHHLEINQFDDMQNIQNKVNLVFFFNIKLN
jgi:hypothetical protein